MIAYLQQLYGYNPSECAKNLMNLYNRCYQERDYEGADRIAANQAEFQEAIADEIARFERPRWRCITSAWRGCSQSSGGC